MVSLNNLTDQSQFITTGTSGTDFNIVSSGDTHTFNIPSASATNRGLVTIASQSFAGIKTFNDAIKGEVGVLLKNGVISSSNGYTALNSFENTLIITSLISGTPFSNNLEFAPSTSNTYTFPNASGTIALTSNLSAYVPYTGATTNVNLGSFELNAILVKAITLEAKLNGTASGNLVLRTGTNGYGFGNDAFSLASSPDYDNTLLLISNKSAVTKTALININSLTADRTYTFPDLSGTLALLEGTQTFTGDKLFNGTVDFNNSVDINSGLFIRNNVIGSTLYTSFTITKASSTQTLSYLFSTGFASNLLFNDAANYSYTFPTASGTIALTSNLSAYVPYTGATSGVNLGAFDLLVNGVKVGIGSGSINSNTILGLGSLNGNTTGYGNTAIGYATLNLNTTGYDNTAIGYGSLNANTTGFNNTALGSNSLYSNTTGHSNTSLGYISLYSNTIGVGNTSVGYGSLANNTTGFSNVAVGYNSMLNSNGNENTAIGNQSMQLNTNGVSNTAIGHASLQSNTTGNNNIAIGYESGKSITTGSNNTIIGNYAGTTTLANNIVLADGAGNIRYQWNGTNNVFGNPISGTSATFSSSVGVGGATNTLGFLEVWKSGSSIAQLSIGQNATYHTDFFIDATGNFYVQPQGNTAMTILSGGNVGIGTTSPNNALLDVSAGGYQSSDIVAINIGANIGVTNRSSNTRKIGNITGQHYNNTDKISLLRVDSAASTTELKIGGTDELKGATSIEFATASSTTATPTTKMIITSGGNVGIGTSSPQNRLTVNTPLRSDGETNSLGAMVVAGAISSSASNDFTNSTAIFRVQGSNATNSLQFGVGSEGYNYNPWIQGSFDNSSGGGSDFGSKAILLNPIGGNVLIGTTTDSGFKLQVNGSARLPLISTENNLRIADTNVAYTLFTISAYGLYIVYVDLPAGSGTPSEYSAYAIISHDGTTARILQQTDASRMFITLSGNNVQGRQTSGGQYNIRHVYQRIGV
jgi:hypothetical protein